MSNEERIFNAAISDGMPEILAKIIVAQSKHETGNYKHRFFTKGNNAFGYSYNKNSKWQISGGDKADNNVPIAQYRSVEDSTHELTDWIKRRQKEGKFPKDLNLIQSASRYAQLLKASGYYQAPLTVYTNALVNHLKTLPKTLSGGLPIFIILFISVAIILLTTQKF